MSNEIKIIVMGAMGRMGQMILEASLNHPGLMVQGAVELKGSAGVGSGTGIRGIDVKVVDNLGDVIDPECVVIDFTVPDATLYNLEIARQAGAGVVIGTTGFDEPQKAEVHKAGENIPVLMSPNMSLGVNICFKISELIAGSTGNKFDVEIVEAHHNLKKDAPSGTALGLAESIARGLKVNLPDVVSYGRQGASSERQKGEIGIHAVRGGDIAGDHTVLFAGQGERIEIKHVAHNRSPFANGALTAAQFLAGKNSGFYTMADVLGLG